MHPLAVGTAVDVRRNAGQSGNQIHRIVVRVGPVVTFWDARLVGLPKFSFCTQRHDGHHKLRHRMGSCGKRINCLENVLRNNGPTRPTVAHATNVVVRRHLVHEHQIEQPFRQRLLTAGILRQFFLQLGDAVPAKTNAFFGVQLRRFANQGQHAAHALIQLSHCDLTDHFIAFFGNELFYFGYSTRNFGCKVLF